MKITNKEIVDISAKISSLVGSNEGDSFSKMVQYLESSDEDIFKRVSLLFDYLMSLKVKDKSVIQEFLKPLSDSKKFTNKLLYDIEQKVEDKFSGWVLALQNANLNKTPMDKKVVSNEASLTENIENSVKPVNTKNKKPPLVYLLNRIENRKVSPYKKYVSVKEDSQGYETKFNNNIVKVGDKSSLTYKNANITNTVSVNTDKNDFVISHQKDVSVKKELIADSIFSVIDYMNDKKEVPFTFSLNIKTPMYLDSVINILYPFTTEAVNQIKDNNEKKTQNLVFKKVMSFKINGISISKKTLFALNKNDFKKKMEELWQQSLQQKNDMFNKGSSNLLNKKNNANKSVVNSAVKNNQH